MTAIAAGEHSSSWPLPSGFPDSKGSVTYEHHQSDRSDFGSATVIRSASSNELASLSGTNGTSTRSSLRRNLSENVLASPDGPSAITAYSLINEEKHENEDLAIGKGRKAGLVSRSEVGVPQIPLDSPDILEEDALEMNKVKASWPLAADGKRRSMSRSLSRLARRSWMSSSRSPSPSPSKQSRTENGSILSESPSLTSLSSSSSALNTQEPPMASRPPAKGQRRPLGTLMNKKASEPTIPSVPSIPTFFPAKKSPAVGNRATAKTPTNPALASVERAQNTGIETSHKKDDLWGALCVNTMPLILSCG